MKMVSEQRIAASRLRVWEALNDPEILRASIPGCQSLDKEANDRFSATVEAKVGPIGARFKGTVSLTELDAPNGYTLKFQGSGGIAGSVKGSAQLRLRDEGAGTLLSYDVDAQVGGRMTQLGGPIIDATSKQLAGKFFSRFGEIVTGAKTTAPPTVATSPNAAVGSPAKVAGASYAHSVSLPIAWILAIVVGVLSGFLFGRSGGSTGSDWAGLAIGLLVVVVAGVAFEYGRRTAAPVVLLDSAGLRRLLDGAKE
jgi:carbon monoxide dehydrogenase subunit G